MRTRRAILHGLGGLAASALVPLPPAGARDDGAGLHRFDLHALGIAGRVTLRTEDADRVAGIAACRARLARVDRALSLYRAESDLARLNRLGALAGAAPDLSAALALALEVAQETGGAFDPTVQPLWTLYARAFGPEERGGPPDPAALAAALARVDHRAVWRDPGEDRIAFARPGMALTLNGVAQGHAADLVAGVLAAQGVRDYLVDLGEFRAAGTQADGRPWRVGVVAPVTGRLRLLRVLEPGAGGLATSAGYATPFAPGGEHHHIFDPATGRSAQAHASVTVMASSAARADAYATAFAAMPRPAIADVVARQPDLRAMLVGHDGAVLDLGDPPRG